MRQNPLPNPSLNRTHNGMSEHAESAAKLCPELQAILRAELQAGNAISESWSEWGLGVLLRDPFHQTHYHSGRIEYRDLNDPHYWKAEYSCPELKQIVGCRF
ncbi:hypothetical protein [Roseateles sp. PN1]|uniref:hypothetical protein n=1 Tax=Roseateles sp. PN1 TaxID=3137372 RepID=UPI003139D2ED